MRALRAMLVAFSVSGAAVGLAIADQSKPATEKAAAVDTVVTGQHRGFTNDKLYLRLDDDKEITLLVDIPGDKDRQWQKDFQMNSRVTVTYHQNADGKLVATSIKAAAFKGK
jgi:hypothetical protein